MRGYAFICLAALCSAAYAAEAGNSTTIQSTVSTMLTEFKTSVTKALGHVSTEKAMQATTIGVVGWIYTGSYLFVFYALYFWSTTATAGTGLVPGIAALMLWRSSRSIAMLILAAGGLLIAYGT